MIWNVRDPIEKQEKVAQRGQAPRYETVAADPGVEDKRLLVVEPEFANVLKQTERQGNSLSAVLRLGWETGDLRSLTKDNPAKATGAHVSIIGHITEEGLRRYLSATESANGFGNRLNLARFDRRETRGRPVELWFAVRGGRAVSELLAIARRFRVAGPGDKGEKGGKGSASEGFSPLSPFPPPVGRRNQPHRPFVSSCGTRGPPSGY